MSKKDLIDAVSRDCELTKEKATTVVDAVLEHIKSALQGGAEVRLPDFGTFKVAARKEREGRNPSTGATIDGDWDEVRRTGGTGTRRGSVGRDGQTAGDGWRSSPN